MFDESGIGVGGDHDDLAFPVGSPEPLDGVNGDADVSADPGEHGIGVRTAETDQAYGSAIADHQGC
jgi:hypothetical protein